MKRGREAAAAAAPTEQKMVGAWIPRTVADKSAIAIRALKYKNMREFILASLNNAIAEAQNRGYPLEAESDNQRHSERRAG